MQEETLLLNVDDVQFDLENPRIKMALEKYGDKMDAERVYFALRTATPDETSGGAAGGFSQLRASIRAYGGINQPIVVVEQGGKMVCIDGNTRLAIYKDFRKEGIPGEWSKIRATLMRDATQLDIEKIRTSAHLVGARQWPAYEKARYLHYLRNQEFMDYDEMIALCGGNKADIERQIDAFNDMNEYYRDAVEKDDEFKIDRFSGFKELQNPGIKASIYEAGLRMEDFGKWIKDGQISKLATVRQLPKVLRDEEAKKIFLGGGIDSISDAVRHVDEKNRKSSSNENVSVGDAPIALLAQTLRQKLNDMPSADYRAWRKAEEMPDEVQTLEDLRETLEEILTDVREQ